MQFYSVKHALEIDGEEKEGGGYIHTMFIHGPIDP